MHCLSASLAALACPGQADPGTIAVVDGDFALATFALAPAVSSQYQIDYPTGPGAPSTVWLDGAGTQPAVPFTTYIARSLGDSNSDGVVNAADIAAFVGALINGPFNPAGDFNDDMLLDTNDVPGFVNALLASFPARGVFLYVQGLSASTALGDAAIDLYTVDPSSGEFVLTATQPVTVVDLTFNPLSGPLGTPITITMTPAIAPLAFDATTTAQWAGVFDPMVGGPTAPFSVSYTASQFHESSAGQAVVVIGDGSATNAPDAANLEGPGSVNGTLEINVAGNVLGKTLNFAPPVRCSYLGDG